MLAYLIPTENRFARTKGEAAKLGFGDETDIPLDKDGLLAFINDLLHQIALAKADSAYRDEAPLPLADSLMVSSGAMDAKDVLSKDQVRVVNHTGESFEGTREQAAGWLVPKPKPDFSATAVLARSDNPGGSIDMIVEAIAKMKGGAALKRVAGAVAVKFEELSK